MTAPLDLDALKKLCDAAAPGPWMNGRMRHVHEDDASEYSHFVSAVDVTSGGDEYPTSPVALMTEPHEPNAEFIAAARTALPALIAEVERLRAVVAAVAASVDGRIDANAAVTLVRGALRDAATAPGKGE